MDNNIEMSVQDAEELNRLLGLDSANMPNSMAVNQQLAASASGAPVVGDSPRSKYYGVYHNHGDNAVEFPFRAAVRLGTKKKPRYVNLGYFKCEHVSAIAYNVAAINYFGKGAWINPVATELCDPAEYDRYKELREDYIAMSVTAMKEMHAAGNHPHTVDLNRTAAEQTVKA